MILHVWLWSDVNLVFLDLYTDFIDEIRLFKSYLMSHICNIAVFIYVDEITAYRFTSRGKGLQPPLPLELGRFKSRGKTGNVKEFIQIFV